MPFAKMDQSCDILRQTIDMEKAWEMKEQFHCRCVWAVVMSWLEWGLFSIGLGVWTLRFQLVALCGEE